MATKYQKGDLVQYRFGDAPKYQIMTTLEEPGTESDPSRLVPKGYDYIIATIPIGEFSRLQYVHEHHLTPFS